MLEEAVEKFSQTENWQQFLKGMRSFHKYSLNNQWLIAVQREDTHWVKGYRAWQDLGRQVVKGSEAIWILAPRPYTKEREDGTEEKKIAFRAIPVFAYEDTEPIEGFENPWEPPVRQPVTGDPEAAQRLLDSLFAYTAAQGIPVVIEAKKTSAGGSYTPADNSIWLQPYDPVEQARVLVHELGHAATYKTLTEGGKPYDYSFGEAVAESIAYVVCGEFGIDTTLASVQYIAVWDADRLRETASIVKDACSALFDWLDRELGEEAREDVAA